VVRTKINELGQKILKILDIPIPKIITPSQEFETKLKMQRNPKEAKQLEQNKAK